MKDIAIHLILEYLKNNGLVESYLHLEQQSKIPLKHYPKQIQFLKKILIKGDFTEAVKFIWTFQNKVNPRFLTTLSFQIMKQKFYELLENPNQSDLKDLFEKDIIDFCSQEQYQEIFTRLTCRGVKQIPGMEDWTPLTGRHQCFESILPYLEPIFTDSTQQQNLNIQFDLQGAIRYMMANISNINNKSQKQVIAKSPQNSNYNLNKPLNQSYQSPNTNNMQISESRVEKSQTFAPKNNLQRSQIPKKINNFTNNLPNNSSLIKSNAMETHQFSQFFHDPKKDPHKDHVTHEPFGLSGNYLKQFEKQSQINESEILKEEVIRNIAYLDKNNEVSEMLAEENQNFTFSNGAQESAYIEKPKKIFKLSTIIDPKAIRACQFSPSGLHFALGTNSSFLKIFNVQELFEQNIFKEILPQYQIPQLHSKSIFSLDWSCNQKAIVTCSNDLTIKITDFISDTYKFSAHRTNIIGRHESCIRMAKFNPNQTKVVSCGDDCLIKLWDIGKIKKCLTLKGHAQGVSAFKFAQNQSESIIYSVGKDSVVRKWDARVGSCINISTPQDSEMTFIANNTDKIAVSHKNGYVSFFDQDLQLEQSIKIHQQQIRSIDGNSYNDELLTSSFDGNISIFSSQKPENPDYHQHNETQDDKVVFAAFLNHPDINGFASTSTLGICNIFSYE